MIKPWNFWGSRIQTESLELERQVCIPTRQEVEAGFKSILGYKMSLRSVQITWDCLKWSKITREYERRILWCTTVNFENARAENRGGTGFQMGDSVYTQPGNKPGQTRLQLLKSELGCSSERLGFFQCLSTSWIGFTLWKVIKLPQPKYVCVSMLFRNKKNSLKANSSLT